MTAGEHLRRAGLACGLALVSACGGGDVEEAAPAVVERLSGARVANAQEALEIVARGVAAPIHYAELSHALLARMFQWLEQREPDAAAPVRCGAMAGGRITWLDRDADERLSPGDGVALWLDGCPVGAHAVLGGAIGLEIEAADNAEGLLLRQESGSVRVRLTYSDVTLDGASARIDGALVLEAVRTPGAPSAARSSDATGLAVTLGEYTMRWSHLSLRIDGHDRIQTLVASAELPGAAGPLWLDSTEQEPGSIAEAGLTGGRFIAAGVIGFLQARLALDVSADGGWTIEVDNDKDDAIDFVAHATPAEAKRLIPGA